jgi:tripartite-type tricarboxylate transporter receptor subunit TctC
MKLSSDATRRKLLGAAAGIAIPAPLASPPTLANEPMRRRIICPFAPGGISDRISRVVAAEAQSRTGETWIVENIGGGGGLIGSLRAARSAPDGRTVVLAATGVIRTLAGRVSRESDFDPLRDLRAIALIGELPMLCVAQPSVAAPTLREYAEFLRSGRIPFAYASSGHASTSHVIGAVIAQEHGLEVLHVPYAGAAPAVAALLGGHVPCAIVDPMPVASMLSTGSLRALGVSSSTRHSRLPHIATIAELGFQRAALTSWTGFLVAAATPKTVLAMLGQVLSEIMRSDSVRNTLDECFIEGPHVFGDEAQSSVTEDARTFQQMMADTGIVLS